MAKKRLPIKDMTLRQLRKVASEYGISRYSRMRKAQLLEAIQGIERTQDTLNQSHSIEVKKTLGAAKLEFRQQDCNSSVLADIDQG
ncbi:Rho termination factor N-terminal domain-containing protein, partial [Richelia intracellularis]|uniref:Rho termination factor N-terminal domain-containing protein n=1 Tax=Richelia intracellularis TaxID=1164990 RepID=UPI0005C4E073